MLITSFIILDNFLYVILFAVFNENIYLYQCISEIKGYTTHSVFLFFPLKTTKKK